MELEQSQYSHKLSTHAQDKIHTQNKIHTCTNSCEFVNIDTIAPYMKHAVFNA